jgi:hypothetical protein
MSSRSLPWGVRQSRRRSPRRSPVVRCDGQVAVDRDACFHGRSCEGPTPHADVRPGGGRSRRRSTSRDDLCGSRAERKPTQLRRRGCRRRETVHNGARSQLHGRRPWPECPGRGQGRVAARSLTLRIGTYRVALTNPWFASEVHDAVWFVCHCSREGRAPGCPASPKSGRWRAPPLAAHPVSPAPPCARRTRMERFFPTGIRATLAAASVKERALKEEER